MGRESQGVRSMRLASGDYIVDMTIIKPNTQIITISENGYGKRSDVSEYRLQSRGGKGIKAGNFNEKTGNLVSLKQSIEEDDILLIADNGVIIRTPISQISSLSRASQGVKVMKLKKDNKIVSVALVKKEDEDEEIKYELELNQANSQENLTNNGESAILDNQNDVKQADDEE